MLENTDRKLLWLWLDVAFGPADKRLWDVMSYYDSVEEMCDDLLSLRCGYVTQQEAEKISCCTFFQAKQVAEYCEKKGIYILTPDDPLYPERLKQIECPPAVLFCRGDVSCLSIEKSVAIIGTREPSDYSVAVAEEFSSFLAERGVNIISGFAMGIDTAAHRSAMRAGGSTVAVMGCGLEYDYPRGRTGFKREIATHGVSISEFFPQARPVPENFRIRNRIVSALSHSVLVVEAGIRSGTLNTVNHALSQNKDVFVIPPHDIFSEKYAGQCALLRDGAVEAYSPKDILYFLNKAKM